MSQAQEEDPRLRETRRQRQALWEVYGHRCAYTGVGIERAEDVEIDHVLPRWLGKDALERARLLERFGLPIDFQIEGNLLNLVPTTKSFNNAKSAKTEPTELVASRIQQFVDYQPYACREDAVERCADELIRHGLGLATKFRGEVEECIRRLKRREGARRLVEEFPEAERGDLADLVDDEVGDAVPFSCRFERWATGFRAQDGAVRLDLFLPTKAAPSGSALLRLRSLRIRDAMIDFDSRELLKTFRGFGGPVEDRPFFVAGGSHGSLVQVQCVRFQLRTDEVRNLCAVIDGAAHEYLCVSEELERTWHALHLMPARRGYRLCDVELSTWVGLVCFATGEGGWSEGQVLCRAIPVRDGQDAEEGSVVAWLHAEPTGEGSRVAVCWDPRDRVGVSEGEGVDDWHAERIQFWLDERAFPSVLGVPRRSLPWKAFLFGRPRELASPVEGRSLRRLLDAYEWRQSAGVAFESPSAMRDALVAMEGHFAIGRRYGGVPAEHLKSVYDLISGFAKRNRVEERRLALAAHALNSPTSGNDLDGALREAVAFLGASGFASAIVVRMALTALFELVGGWVGLDAVSDEERDRAAQALEPLYRHTHSRAYLERLIEREW